MALGSVTLVENGAHFDTYTPYNETFVEELKAIPGRKARWDESKINPKTGKPRFKCWSIPMSALPKLVALIQSFFESIPVYIWIAGTSGPAPIKPGSKYYEFFAGKTTAQDVLALPQIQPVVTFPDPVVMDPPKPATVPVVEQMADNDPWNRSAFDKKAAQVAVEDEVDQAIINLWD